MERLFKHFLCVATVLTVYGIETAQTADAVMKDADGPVATVLTVYGIETDAILRYHFEVVLLGCNSTYRLRY